MFAILLSPFSLEGGEGHVSQMIQQQKTIVYCKGDVSKTFFISVLIAKMI